MNGVQEIAKINKNKNKTKTKNKKKPKSNLFTLCERLKSICTCK